MATAQQSLLVALRGTNADLIKVLKDSDRKIKALQKSATGVGTAAAKAGVKGKQGFKQIGDGASRAGKKVGVLAGGLKALKTQFGAIAGLFAGGFIARTVITEVIEFQDEMAQVKIVTQATGEEFGRLREAALEMGSTTVFTAKESAEALKFLGQSGLDASQAIAVLPTVLDLAAGSGQALGLTAQQVTGIMSAFNLSIGEASRVTDLLVIAQANAQNSVSEFAEGIAKVGPVAANAGIGLDTVTAALGVLADRMVRGSDGGTALRNVIARLAAPASAARKALKSLGIALDEVNPDKVGLLGALDRLREAGLKDTGDAAAIFGVKMFASGLILVQNTKDVRENIEAYQGVAGAARAAAKEMEETLGGALKLLRSQFSGLILDREGGISAVGAALTRFAGGVLTVLDDGFNALTGTIQALGAVVFKVSGLFLSQLAPAIDSVINRFRPLLEILALSSSALRKLLEEQDRLAQKSRILALALDESAEALRREAEATFESIGRTKERADAAAVLASKIDLEKQALELKAEAERMAAEAEREALELAKKAAAERETMAKKREAEIASLTAFVSKLADATERSTAAGGISPISPTAVADVQGLQSELDSLIQEEERLRDSFLLTAEESNRSFEISREISEKQKELKAAEVEAVLEVVEAGRNVVASEEEIAQAREQNRALQEKLLELSKSLGVDGKAAVDQIIESLKVYDAQLGLTNTQIGTSVEALGEFEATTVRLGEVAATELGKVQTSFEQTAVGAADLAVEVERGGAGIEIFNEAARGAADNIKLIVDEAGNFKIITVESEKTATAVEKIGAAASEVEGEISTAATEAGVLRTEIDAISFQVGLTSLGEFRDSLRGAQSDVQRLSMLIDQLAERI